MLDKMNGFLRKIGIPLNIINILIGLVMGIAYVYIPFTSIAGLILGIIMAISGSATIGISYFFTSKNTNIKQEKPPQLENTKASNLFLGFAIPMIMLNSASCFFGMYTGILLLSAALATPLAPAAITIIAVILASTLTVGTLINSWLQTHNIWQSLKKPALTEEATPANTPPEPIKTQITNPSEQVHTLTVSKQSQYEFQAEKYSPSFFSESRDSINNNLPTCENRRRSSCTR